MKKINFAKVEFTESDGKQNENYWELLDAAAGGKEANDKYGEITDAFIAAVTPANLKGVDYPELPDEIHKIVSKFEDLMSAFDTLAKMTGFNAGAKHGFAQGALLGVYGNASNVESPAAEVN